MAKYRQFHVRFWKDPDIEQLEPIEKLIFAYLFTNDGCTESGIYPITLKTISNETGISVDDVKTRFEKGIKNIVYDWDNNIIFVARFLEHNGGGRPDLLLSAIRKECKTTETDLWHAFLEFYPRYKEDLLEIIDGFGNGFVGDYKRFANGLPTVYKPFNSNSNSNSNSNRNSKRDTPRNPPKLKPYIERINEYFDSRDIEVCLPYWSAAYPNVSIKAELKKAKAWLVSNPKRAKSDFRKFCNNWLKNEVEKISRRGGSEIEQTPEQILIKAREVYLQIYEQAKQQREENPDLPPFTDSSIFAHMKKTLGYTDQTLIELIDNLGGPKKLTGKFPRYHEYKKGKE